MIWTVGDQYTNAFYVFNVLIETTGNNIFSSSYRLDTVYLTMATFGGPPPVESIDNFSITVSLFSFFSLHGRWQ